MNAPTSEHRSILSLRDDAIARSMVAPLAALLRDPLILAESTLPYFHGLRREILRELIACERADARDADEYLAAAERLGALASDEHAAAEDQAMFHGGRE